MDSWYYLTPAWIRAHRRPTSLEWQRAVEWANAAMKHEGSQGKRKLPPDWMVAVYYTKFKPVVEVVDGRMMVTHQEPDIDDCAARLGFRFLEGIEDATPGAGSPDASASSAPPMLAVEDAPEELVDANMRDAEGGGVDMNDGEPEAAPPREDERVVLHYLCGISRDAWLQFEEPETGRRWWKHHGTTEYFYEGDEGWVKYFDQERGLFWWYQEATERWFYQ